MARANSVFTKALASLAEADLAKVGRSTVAVKLRAIVSAAKYPTSTVADIIGVSVETLWRWATAYRESGLEGLCPKPRRPKPSKLTPEQKATVLSWLNARKTATGDVIHWTLERLRLAIIEEFGVTLGTNTIWVWLRKEGWKPKVPRPRHHSADKEAQAEFKKKTSS